MSKLCDNCENKVTEEIREPESFAMELLKGYKKQFYVTVTILSSIIALLFGYIVYDAYVDSQYETIEYVQDGQGYNNINTGTQGDVLNGAEAYRIKSAAITDNLLKKWELDARLKHGWIEVQGANTVVTSN